MEKRYSKKNSTVSSSKNLHKEMSWKESSGQFKKENKIGKQMVHVNEKTIIVFTKVVFHVWPKRISRSFITLYMIIFKRSIKT